MMQNHFYNTTKDVRGHDHYLLDAKLMVSLKHLALGAITSAWQDYFQMGYSTS